ncbi:hypothetical protein GVN18_38285 [Pseudomonas sp. ODNR1LW]|nr:hypothetical protein [Pseudomonas sp. ODNR1LW]
MTSTLSVESSTYNTLRCKSPVYAIPLPHQFFHFLGQTLVLWSVVDSHIEDLRLRMERCSGTVAVKHSPMNKRLANFRALTDTCFGDHPALHEFFVSLHDDVSSVKEDRDLFAHGSLALGTGKGGGFLIAKGRVRRKEVERSYNLEELEAVFYSISHLAGRLYLLPMEARRDKEFFLPLPSREKSVLRNFFEKTDQSSAIPDTQHGPPQSSPQ